MNKQDKYLWDTMKLLITKLKITRKDLNENYEEILQQLYADFFIEIYKYINDRRTHK